MDLTLTNPNGVALAITRLTVRVSDVRVTNGRGLCTRADFEVHQFSGAYGFVVSASHTATLTELGIPGEYWPRLVMINRPVNQDGCKRAAITLSFRGRTVGVER